MIKAYIGDITKLKDVDYICNAANGYGPMGAGVAGAIKRAGGVEIERDAIRVCKEIDPQEGDIYPTIAGTLPFKQIIHLVTMKHWGSRSKLSTVEKCLQNLIHFCHNNEVNKIALPALGTGVGRLGNLDVCKIYKKILGPVEDVEFHIVDINENFIDHF